MKGNHTGQDSLKSRLTTAEEGNEVVWERLRSLQINRSTSDADKTALLVAVRTFAGTIGDVALAKEATSLMPGTPAQVMGADSLPTPREGGREPTCEMHDLSTVPSADLTAELVRRGFLLAPVEKT